jgi:hypothetical protein
MKEILLVQQSAVDEYERCQQGRAMARQEVPPQQVDAGGKRVMNNALWIPERAVELQLRLCVEAHCRSAGYRAYEATLGAIKEYVAWTTMAKDVKVFVQNCLHSRTSARPTTIRWSFRRIMIFYWYCRDLSMSTSVASKSTRWIGKNYRRSK